MRQVLPSRLRHRFDAVEVTTVRGAGVSPAAAVPLDVLLTLAQAVRDRVTVRFDYLPRGEGDPQPRRVEPHHLVTSHGRWYLLGWDLDRDDWRLFSADRVRPRVPHGAPFVSRVVPGGDVDAFVSARFKGSDTNEWLCRGTVLLHASARDVLPFAGDGTVTAVDEERCTLEVGSWSWGALAASFGRLRWQWRSLSRRNWPRRSRCRRRGFAAAGPSARSPGEEASGMTQPLRYAINVTLDGCCSHEAGLPPDAESMAFWTDELRRSDTLLYGRVTYELMQGAWRPS